MFSKASLEMLDTVARLGSFTAAAEVLHKVPSAISYGVRQVEQDLDVVLFRRLPRKVELTPAGELFMAEARSLLRQMEEVKAQTRRAAHGWKTTLKLTLDNVVKLEKLKPLVEDFYREFEFAELQINMEVFNGSWEAIAQGRADIVVGATSAVPVGGDFEVKDMGVLDWAFVMSPAHPCVRQQVLTEEFVSQFPAICLDDTSNVLPKRHTGHYELGSIHQRPLEAVQRLLAALQLVHQERACQLVALAAILFLQVAAKSWNVSQDRLDQVT